MTLQFSVATLLVTLASASAAQHAITIDGQLQDWSPVAPAVVDAIGDGRRTGADFASVSLANDDDLLFLYISVAAPIDLAENNLVVMYLDTDNDPRTGLAIEGLGAELVWNFGTRQGTAHLPGGAVTVQHDAIRFRGGPTVTADSFEIAIGRQALPNGSDPLFQGNEISVVLTDLQSGDRIPDVGNDLIYELGDGEVTPPVPISLERFDKNDLRLITYNVLTDNPWNPTLAANFGAQITALSPDILAFQEIYNHTPTETVEWVSGWLPEGPWHGAGHADCITISRFPILESWGISGNHIALIDATPLGSPLLVINVHLPCCTNDSGRQAEVDHILQFLRDETSPGGTIPQNTPVVFTGDTNFVGLAQQLTSILTGDVVNEAVFGPDFAPDWDGTALRPLFSRHTAQRMSYTWRNDASSFWPGHLDYVIYTDSVLEVANNFVLFTPAMSDTTLQRYGLSENDSLASDHLLVCADLRAAGPTQCRAHGDCADLDRDDIRDDVCLWWSCAEGTCQGTDIVYGDMGGQFGACTPDGTSDGNDRFHALNCFANASPDGGNYTCEVAAPTAFNVDTAGQFGSCQPDGVCDGNDAFAALNAFNGTATCTCPLDGQPAPGGHRRR